MYMCVPIELNISTHEICGLFDVCMHLDIL